MIRDDDTIAAIGTAPGEAAISVVRLSGPDSLAISDRVFACRGPKPGKRAGNTFVRGHVVSGRAENGSHLDEVILLIYRAPHSYTRQDVVEFQGHGGTVSAKRILRVLLDAGARAAEPGEFTRRAFLSGRIDLTQAEAVLDMIRSRSDRAANAAMEQLDGRLTASIASIYDSLMEASSWIQSSLDFADDEMPHDPFPTATTALERARSLLLALLATWDEGHALREGALAVIAGRPNVGKSTLLNTMLGRPRAIVHHLPGTTRDTLEETIVLEGIPIRLVDTAGLRNSRSQVETHGVSRARAALATADLCLYMIDASKPLAQRDRTQIELLEPRRTVIILNKSDMGLAVSADKLKGYLCIPASLKTGAGIDEIKSSIVKRLNIAPTPTPHAVISERHRSLLVLAKNDLESALTMLATKDPGTLALSAASARYAADSVALITGRTYHSDLLDQVFSRFCIGK